MTLSFLGEEKENYIMVGTRNVLLKCLKRDYTDFVDKVVQKNDEWAYRVGYVFRPVKYVVWADSTAEEFYISKVSADD